jgi:hypothetical protein
LDLLPLPNDERIDIGRNKEANMVRKLHDCSATHRKEE